MSELLNSLNVPSETSTKSWASEVAEAAASEPATVAAEPVSTEPATVEPETKEAAVEAPQTQETATEEQDRRVPLKALQEERQKRAEYERQLQEYQRREQEWQAWAAQQQQMQPQEEVQPEPDPETDPIGALKAAQERLQMIQQEAQERAYVEQLNTVAYQAATQFQSQVPDYQDAYRYALNSRAQELMTLGTPQHAIPQILQQEELRLIDTALQSRRNPAEVIYQFAKARGFQGKTAQPAAAAPAPAPTPVAPDPALQQARREVAASASSGGAPASKGQISPADLANLNGAAFDAAWNKMFSGNKSSVFRE